MANVAPTGTIFSTNSVRIQEIINKNVEMFLPSLDTVWRNNIVTSQGVAPASNIGRDLKVLKTYMGGFAGVLESAGPRGDFPLYGDDTAGTNATVGAKLLQQAVGRAFPNALEGPMAAPYRLGIPMRAMVANIALTLGEMTAEATPAFIGEVIAPKLEGFAKMIAHTLCNYWYLSQNNYYQLASWATAPTTGNGNLTGSGTAASPYRIKFTPSNLAVDRFFVGQRVDIYNSTGVTRKNETGGQRIRVFVDSVDELKGRVTLVVAPSTTGGPGVSDPSTWSLANADIVVYANSFGAGQPFTGAFTSTSGQSVTATNFTGIAGVNSWLKTGDTNTPSDCVLMGGEGDSGNHIDVLTHPEFKSFGRNMLGQPLTEHELRKVLRRWHVAKKKYGQSIDCLIASDGVWLAYEAQKIGREEKNRDNNLSNVNHEGSQEGFRFTFDGKSYEGYTSTYVESGTVYGIKKGNNNWKRYVPPSPKNMRKNDRLEAFIPFEFVGAALTGTSSIQIPIFSIQNNQNLVTEAVQLPGMLRMQLVPDQAAGIKLTNCAEDRTYSDN
jgi:hypothetical protein